MLKKSLRVPVGKFPQRAETVLRSGGFTIKASPNKLTHSRVGVVIRKGVLKKAVHRNKVKRVVFKLFSEHNETLNHGGTDYLVVIGQIKSLDADGLDELTRDLEQSILKLKLKHDNRAF